MVNIKCQGMKENGDPEIITVQVPKWFVTVHLTMFTIVVGLMAGLVGWGVSVENRITSNTESWKYFDRDVNGLRSEIVRLGEKMDRVIINQNIRLNKDSK